MDATIRKIIEEVVKEHQLDAGYILRILEQEEKVAHLIRRHGIFDDLREITRKYAQRIMNVQGGDQK